jgi:phosphatidylserine/phosphatidylglycerophosphate/cardiolipin synthase-like enzyme
MDDLSCAIASAAQELPEGLIERLARALQSIDGFSLSNRARLEAAAPDPASRVHADSISSAWERVPNQSGASLALALRSATLATSKQRASEIVEVAWTGPETLAVPVRKTITILLDLIQHSHRNLLIVSFAAYKVPEILQALKAAASAGVDMKLLLESTEESMGALRFDAKEAFIELQGQARFYSWPTNQRGPSDMPRGTLHAKAVVADAERALVTSANLTGHALEINMELGLLVEGGPIPRRLTNHFNELIARGILREVEGG